MRRSIVSVSSRPPKIEATPLRDAPAARGVWLAALALVLAGVAAYHNSFSGPFVFDDRAAIVDNPSIRRLGALADVLAPARQGGLTVAGRPLVNLSLAVNFAISGTETWSYHGFNLLVHLAAGLALFGIVRRTLHACDVLPGGLGRRDSTLIALSAAGLWMLHPLQTESVTYVVQRAESLAGLMVLLMLYAFVRGVGLASSGAEPARRGWWVASVGACVGAMASKEVAVSAPLLVLLYDRTFVSGGFGAAWRARRGYYMALGGSWLLLAVLVFGTGNRGGTAGFGAAMSPWAYALTQCRAIVHYVRLSFWPEPLVFDYGIATVRDLGAVLPQVLGVLTLVGATLWALWRRPVAGYLGAWFLALLAPSSSFVPVVTQTMAEHRMYLALAAPVVALVVASLRIGRGVIWGWGVVALACAVATSARNTAYRSEIALWADTAAKIPANARAHNNLGEARFRAGEVEAAIASYRRALALQPRYPETHYNLGVALAARGELAAAIQHYEAALHIDPDYPEALNNLGNALVAAGRVGEALPRYEEAIARKPAFAEAQNNLGNALLQLGRAREALPRFEAALQLKPDYAEAIYNLGNAYAALGDMPRALQCYRTAIALRPGYAEAHVNAGNAALALARPDEAVAYYQHAIAARPELPDAHANLGSVLLDLGRWADAVPEFETVLRLAPARVEAHRALGFALAKLGRTTDAVAHYEHYLRAAPGDREAQAELAALQKR